MEKLSTHDFPLELSSEVARPQFTQVHLSEQPSQPSVPIRILSFLPGDEEIRNLRYGLIQNRIMECFIFKAQRIGGDRRNEEVLIGSPGSKQNTFERARDW